ncbi:MULTISPECIES: DUF2929 family protein [Apilactobacillus]|uniref:DUF2929 family protein n=2 Tax=Apilactobacillus TaxID=2767877 RepID=A0ABY2YYG3_9LACO|nr:MULTISPECIES: DUF2929 family protein [Apilactobacillus]TPR13876.1 DUF2929 family protein [Apilactobacillus timberlakei]TPR15192.1 DUF2929 family protein [Apilactobacillus timberlakei]TPR17083.1 DUF2929 family protein [Apilactobacillus timberlakei]TPR17485.1 DUF2929 family protein [Apilactobacillus timberlakei]TPR20076.1 DUF2929 family protein [Apilactobacillus timberlakei]
MKFLTKNLTVVFWSAIFGEIIGYIVGQLESQTYSSISIAVVTVITALILVNCVTLISGNANK